MLYLNYFSLCDNNPGNSTNRTNQGSDNSPQELTLQFGNNYDKICRVQ